MRLRGKPFASSVKERGVGRGEGYLCYLMIVALKKVA